MSSLYRRSKVFADVQNMVVSYDAIVASRLNRYFQVNKGPTIFFQPELFELTSFSVDELKFKIMAEKKNRNFLLDFFDWSRTDLSPDEINPMAICDTIYQEILQLPPMTGDALESDDISIIMTSVGKSLQVLSTDTNLEVIYLYVGNHVPKEIKRGLKFFYVGSSSKMQFLEGPRDGLHDFFKTNLCDSYFFEDSSDIDEYIAKKHVNLSEVILPGNNVNLSIVDSVDNTNLRLPILNLSLDDYKDKFNLDIHTAILPI